MSKAKDIIEMAKVAAGPDVLKRLKSGDTVVDDQGNPIKDPHVGLGGGYMYIDKGYGGNLEFRRLSNITGDLSKFTIYKGEFKVFKDFVKKNM